MCTCGIVYHYPIYGDRPLIEWSNLLYACTNHSFALSPASRWHRRAGRLTPPVQEPCVSLMK